MQKTSSTLIPFLRYRDAKAAIDWLCKVFGFERHAVYEDDQDGIANAQLTFGRGGGMIMLSSVRETPCDRYNAQPDDTGGRSTQSVYAMVADCKAHYERARAGGAEIVLEYESKDYGGGGYTCRDLEGHLWSFGSYNPW